VEYKLLEPVVDDPSLRGEQMPRLWTAPPRHIEVDGTCPSCGGVQKVRPGTGCGDYLSADILDWAKGIGYDLDPWQKWTLTQGLGVKPDGKWSSFENTLIISRQNGKGDCALSEPLYTTSRGWVTYADVMPGDFVLGSDGKPTRVLATSPVFTDRDCYEVEFTDGSKVVASQYHLWHVQYRASGPWKDISTEELAETVGGRRPSNGRMEYNWRVRCDTVPELPEADLPVDPYLLGSWLGDGASRAANITVGAEDASWMTERLYQAGARKAGWAAFGERPEPVAKDGTAFTVAFRIYAPMRDGFESRMRNLGIWGDKRIPEIYLTASVAQRKALLAGLMDTDGSITCNNKTPQCEFTTSIPGLAKDFHRLARSLGIRVVPKWRKTARKDNCRFLFTAPFNPFDMPRKAELWKPPASSRHELMSITAIRRVPSVPTRCIKIAREDGVYLTGKLFTPTHNTILEVRELAGLFVLSEKLIIHTAHELKTAQEHFLRVRETIENNPSLSRRLKGRPRLTNGQEAIELKPLPTLIFGPGGKRVRKRVASRLKFLARSKGSARGFTCDCLIYDEAMILGTEAVGASLPTMAAVPNPQIWFTGSAGLEDSFQLARSRDRIVRDTKDLFGAEWSGVAHLETCPRDMVNGRRANDYIVCDKHDDRDDPRTWAKANPAYGYRLTGDYIRKAELAIMVPVEFDRERNGIGQWPREEAAWKVVSEDLWETLAIPIRNAERGKQMALAVDIDPDGRSATIAASWAHTNGKQIVMSIPNGASRQGTAWVLQRLIQLDRKFKPIAIVVPRSGPAAGLGNDLEKMWPDNPKWKTKLIRATVSDEAAAFAWFKQQCHDRSKPLVHAPEEQVPTMYSALGNAETRVVGDGGMAFSRRDSEQDITPITAASLSAWGLNKKLKKYDPVNSVA
jgi:hypothetical protein